MRSHVSRPQIFIFLADFCPLTHVNYYSNWAKSSRLIGTCKLVFTSTDFFVFGVALERFTMIKRA